ncbi:hypothetical protein [Gordonia hankookensis]|uniref:Uncharacterized protein n=1 Tax=Gordonia hankookensis TaxID=589403 RepID=A0ABR7W6Q0_9ACTN|nr:hypothetical protein [Gordonia hankookensis]MBD1318505.1 hypothetical protein [Gordonia hankookensis]
MNTPFTGARQRGRHDELPLSEFPAWGLEIMMGLYGPETVQSAAQQEPAGAAPPSPPPLHDRRVAPEATGEASPTSPTVAPMSPLVLQLEAVNELVRYVERRIKRHHQG